MCPWPLPWGSGGSSQANLPKHLLLWLALTKATLLKAKIGMHFQFLFALELDCLTNYLDHPFVVIFFSLATLSK